MVEHWTENPGVTSSTLVLSITFKCLSKKELRKVIRDSFSDFLEIRTSPARHLPHFCHIRYTSREGPNLRCCPAFPANVCLHGSWTAPVHFAQVARTIPRTGMPCTLSTTVPFWLCRITLSERYPDGPSWRVPGCRNDRSTGRGVAPVSRWLPSISVHCLRSRFVATATLLRS